MIQSFIGTTFQFDLQRFDSAFSGGTGTEADPYKISSVADLQQLATDVNGGNNYSGKYFKVTADIDLSSISNFTPIGTEDNPFKGTFDGGGYKISNLKINMSEADEVGLFGEVNGGTIKNVTLESASVTGCNYVGALVGFFGENSTIENCKITNSQIYAYGEYDVGGLVGSNIGTIKNCWVISSKVTIDDCAEYVGGLVGENNGKIENCTVTGSIVCNDYSSDYTGTGGLVGLNFEDGEIKGSTVTNTNITGGDDVGGLVGQNNGKISDGTVLGGYVKSVTDTGGFVGANYGEITNALVDNGFYSHEGFYGYIAAQNYGTIQGYYYDYGENYGENVPAIGWNDEEAATSNDTKSVFHIKWLDGLSAYYDNASNAAVTLNQMLHYTDGAAFTIELTVKVDDESKFEKIINNDLATSGTCKVTFKSDDPTSRFVACPKIAGLTFVDNSTSGGGYYYEINDAQDLADLANYVNKNDGYARDCAGLTFKLTADIEDASVLTTAIGTDLNRFAGTFDGGGHTIGNLKITGNGNEDRQGLFGYVDNGGTIKDLTLTGVEISNSDYAGAVVGCNLGTIENVTASGTVGANSFGGGLVGYNYGTISNSTNNVNVTVGNTTDKKGIAGGGIAGDNQSGTISGCKNTGSVTVYDNNSNIGGAGGIVGLSQQNGKVEENCTNTGTITADYNSGGIVGYNQSGTINSVTNEGTILANNYNSGGIVGNNQNDTISNCTNKGNVTANDHNAGGIFGINQANGIINECTNEGTITAKYNSGGIGGENHGVIGYSKSDGTYYSSTNSGKVTATDYNAGGIVGYNESDGYYGLINNCTNRGEVTTKTKSGGIVGETAGIDGLISNCTNVGAISADTDKGGGIVGYNNGGTLEGCVNSGDVTAGESGGGIVGLHKEGSITYCANSGNVLGSSNSVGGIVGQNTSGTAIQSCLVDGSFTVKNGSTDLPDNDIVGTNSADSSVGKNYFHNRTEIETDDFKAVFLLDLLTLPDGVTAAVEGDSNDPDQTTVKIRINGVDYYFSGATVTISGFTSGKEIAFTNNNIELEKDADTDNVIDVKFSDIVLMKISGLTLSTESNVWTVSGTSANYNKKITEGADISDKKIVYNSASENALFTLNGLTATLDNDGNLPGVEVDNTSGTVKLTAAALATVNYNNETTATISLTDTTGDAVTYKLVLAEGILQTKTQDTAAGWTLKDGTSYEYKAATYKDYYELSSDVTCHKASGGETFTIDFGKALTISNGQIAGIEIAETAEGKFTVTVTSNDVLSALTAEKSATLSQAVEGTFTLQLGNNVTKTAPDVSAKWSTPTDGKATYTSAYKDSYFTIDGATISYKAPVGKTEFGVEGLNTSLNAITESEIKVTDDKSVTIYKNALPASGTIKFSNIDSADYTFALDVNLGTQTTADESYSGNTFTAKKYNEYYKAGKENGATTYTYTASTGGEQFEFTGLGTWNGNVTVTAPYDETGVKTGDKYTFTIGEGALNGADITVEDKAPSDGIGYELKLADATGGIFTVNAAAAENLSAADADKKRTYTAAKTAETYKEENGNIIYTKSTGGDTCTITGLGDGAVLNTNISVENKKVKIKGAALSSTHEKISVTSDNNDYTIELDNAIDQVKDISFSFSKSDNYYQVILAGTTEGYKSDGNGGYDWQNKVNGEELTIRGLGDDVTLTAEMFTHENDKVIFKPTQSLLPANPASIIITEGAIINTSGLTVTEEVKAHWDEGSYISDKTASSWTTGASTVNFTASTGGETLFTLTNVNVTADIAIDTANKVVTLKNTNLKGDNVTITGDYNYTLDLADDVKKKEEIVSEWTTLTSGNVGNVAYLEGGTGNYYSLAEDKRTISYTAPVSEVVKENKVEFSGVKGTPTLSGTTVKLTADNFADNVNVVSNAGGYDFSLTGDFANKTFTGTANADLISNSGKNILIAGGASADTLVNEKGESVTLTGGDGKDTFIFKSGTVTISDYTADDIVSLSGTTLSPFTDVNKLSFTDKNLTLKFSDANTLTFTGESTPPTVSVKSGEDTYIYSKDYIALGKGISLSSSYTGSFDGKDYDTIDASAVTTAISIKGNDNANKIIGGKAGGSIDSGAGNDILNVTDRDNTAKFTFTYGGGADSIIGYNIEQDIVNFNLSGQSVVTDTDSIKYSDKNLTIQFTENDSLTFKNRGSVSVKSGEDTYRYTTKSIAKNEEGITLGADYDSNFSAADFDYATIDASKVKNEIKITGNKLENTIYGGLSGTYFDGGDGDDLLIGGTGADTFAFGEGEDSIQGYGANDIVSVASDLNPLEATLSVGEGEDANNLILDFGGGDNLTFINGADKTISVASGNSDNYYVLNKDFIAQGKSITLTSAYSASGLSKGDAYDTIDAAAVTHAISIVANDNANSIIGGLNGGTISGVKGDDKIDITERNPDARFTVVYTGGNDTVDGFEKNDQMSIGSSLINNIKSSKSGNDKLTFTISGKNSFVLQGDDIEKVSLTSNGYLTSDGVVSLGGTSASLKLFSTAKGIIDLTNELYKDSKITSVNAENVKGQSVDLAASSLGGSFTFAYKNTMKDLFTYNGGKVTIHNYEAGKDKINLGDGEISGFTVEGKDVASSVSGYNNTQDNVISIIGAAGQDVLIHHAESRSNSYAKMSFIDNNILYNKASKKNPTAVTVGSGASGYEADETIKKITVADVSGISIAASDKTNTTVDASEANGVSLIGGAKNDKFIGSENNADVFVYKKTKGKAGKDVIEGFGSGDSISIDSGFNLEDAKISVSGKSVKFKFSGNNVLTVKGDSEYLESVSINGISYSFKKNAIIGTDKHATLTAEASGTFKTDKLDVNYIDATQVKKKTLTLTGAKEEADTLIGGGKKTMFKGGGGNDSLIGGSGKDTFVYAKNNTGNVTIDNFDFNNDKLKIANSTITKIESISGGVQFSMNNGRKNGDVLGTFTIKTSAEYDNKGSIKGEPKAIDPRNIVIQANNTYYWFAQGNESLAGGTGTAELGQLITSSAVKKSQVAGFNVIELGYSTDLDKSGVAFKVTNNNKPTK